MALRGVALLALLAGQCMAMTFHAPPKDERFGTVLRELRSDTSNRALWHDLSGSFQSMSSFSAQMDGVEHLASNLWSAWREHSEGRSGVKFWSAVKALQRLNPDQEDKLIEGNFTDSMLMFMEKPKARPDYIGWAATESMLFAQLGSKLQDQMRKDGVLAHILSALHIYNKPAKLHKQEIVDAVTPCLQALLMNCQGNSNNKAFLGAMDAVPLIKDLQERVKAMENAPEELVVSCKDLDEVLAKDIPSSEETSDGLKDAKKQKSSVHKRHHHNHHHNLLETEEEEDDEEE